MIGHYDYILDPSSHWSLIPSTRSTMTDLVMGRQICWQPNSIGGLAVD